MFSRYKYYRLAQGFRVTSLFTGQYKTKGCDTITDVKGVYLELAFVHGRWCAQ